MMPRTLKTLLLWLLIAVLPLHAVAGSFAMSCAPGHQQSSPTVVSSAASQHDVMTDAHASHHGDQASPAADALADEHSSVAKVEKRSHSSCGACSVFCIGAAAPPSSYLPVPTFDGSDAVMVAPAVFAVGFIQEGPQRPPRHHSA